MDNLIQKFILVMKREGMLTAICISVKKSFMLFFRILTKVWKQLSFFVIHKKKLYYISKNCTHKRIYIFLNSLDFNYPLHQRPQQIAKAAGLTPNVISIYVTPKLKYDKFSCVKKLGKQLYLFDIDFMNHINILTNSAKDVILYSTTTANHSLKKHVRHDHYIFDFIDDFSVWPNLTPKDLHQMKREMHAADVLLVTATNLFEEGKRYNKNILLSPNAVDYFHFSMNKQLTAPTELYRKISQKPVIGYYGAFSTWFDYELVYRTAKETPSYIWFLIGRMLDDSLSKSKLLELTNVIYINEISYNELPCYARLFTISIIPFLKNQITEATSPVKLFEYMALGRPILAASLIECKKYKSVVTYESQQDFSCKISNLLNLSSDQILQYQKMLKEEALANTWKERFQEIDNKINITTGENHG